MAHEDEEVLVPPTPPFSPNRRPWRNLILVAIGFFCSFSAFNGTQSLASTLDSWNEHVSGTASVGIIYCVFCVTSVFAPAVVAVLGPTTAMRAQFIFMLLFTLSVLVPSPGTVYPASALIGLGAAPLWVAQGTYTCWLARSSSLLGLSGVADDRVNGLFNGVFYSVFQMTLVAGNLLSSVILDLASSTTLFLVYSGLIVLGLLLLLPLDAESSAGALHESDPGKGLQGSWRVLRGAGRLLRTRKLLLLLPVMVLNGCEQGLIVADYTKMVIKPSLGKSKIGYVMSGYGAGDAAASLVMGKISDRVGRRPVLVLGCALLTACSGLLLYNGTDRAANLGTVEICAIAVIWGAGDGTLQAVISALCGGDEFTAAEQEYAFATFRMLQSGGMAVFFFFSPTSSTFEPKLCVVLSMTVIAGCCLVLGCLCSPAASQERDMRPAGLLDTKEDISPREVSIPPSLSSGEQAFVE